ncbi:hypothetical protein [Bifidobacterium samirii]|uniref:Uncharacterized protein n=1 Tax=Bifidobacterium samirii TaxID=2306974 RepID=A0A430FW71_9BIFI|nr:hypothetical protein [Bifidobacterium samirii]RSX58428.1 hypothetical protein D2E24_0307 [Bifidobacterium samirii]
MAEAEEPSDDADAMMATCPIVVSPFDVDPDDTVVAGNPFVGASDVAEMAGLSGSAALAGLAAATASATMEDPAGASGNTADGGAASGDGLRSRTTIPVPPPSFFPSNTGRIRPITGPVVRVAASPAASASPADEDVDTGERVRVERSSRVIHVNHAATAAAHDGNPPTLGAMPAVASTVITAASPMAAAGTVHVTPAPRMRWSSQYRVLHPDD